MPRWGRAYRWEAGSRAPSATSDHSCNLVGSVPTRGSSSWVCCSCSAPSPSANAMRALLLQVGYDRWILPALLLIPLLGAASILLGGRQVADGEDEVASGAASAPSRLATAFFAIEFVLS